MQFFVFDIWNKKRETAVSYNEMRINEVLKCLAHPFQVCDTVCRHFKILFNLLLSAGGIIYRNVH